VVTSLYADGLDGTVDLVATNQPLYGLDSVAWYVHFPTGVDAVAPAGRDKQKPLKTLARAVANAAENDIIVLLDGHDEIITAGVITFIPGLVIVGCGQTAGVPNVKLTPNLAVPGPLIGFGEPDCQLRNVRIMPNMQTNNVARVNVSNSGFIVDRCQFDCGVNDAAAALSIDVGGQRPTVKDTTFISVATDLATRPNSAMKVVVPIQGIRLDGAVFSDGTHGFTNGYSLDLSAAACTNIMGNKVSLLLGASARMGASATGYIIPVVTGGGVIDI
jgi:hypothetical protein